MSASHFSRTRMLILASFLVPFLTLSHARAASFEVPVQEGDRLVFKGLAAQVQFIAQPGTKNLRVSGIEEGSRAGQFTFSKKDRVIEVRMNDFDSKREWKEALGKTSPATRKLELSGPALPLELHLRDGLVNLQKWSKEAKVSLIHGKVISAGGSGSLQINLQKGEINVTDHNGKISTDSYSGSSLFKDIQGDIDAELFVGQLLIDNAKGVLNLNSQQASTKVLQSSGSLQFENGKGPFVVQGFKGRIDGQTNDGAVNISFLDDSELNLKSKSGRITVQPPAASGASLNLLTIDGDIFVPKEVNVTRTTSEKNVRGRLRGPTQKASIIVRSQEGIITVK